jgi:hypothetical protein
MKRKRRPIPAASLEDQLEQSLKALETDLEDFDLDALLADVPTSDELFEEIKATEATLEASLLGLSDRTNRTVEKGGTFRGKNGNASMHNKKGGR